MPLIVEDGSGVPGAQTYVNAATARAFASARGVTLPADDAACEVLLLKGADYLEARGDTFKGVKSSSAQAMQWPRAGVILFGAEFPEDEIPINLRNAQSQLAIEALAGDLEPVDSGQTISREKVGPLETEYAPGEAGPPTFPRVAGWLAPLQQPGGGASLVSIRV